MRRPRGMPWVAAAGLLMLSGCSAGSSAGNPSSTGSSAAPAPAINTCLKMPSLRALTQTTPIDCQSSHEGQVFAILALPSELTDPTVAAQVTKVRAQLTCPEVRAWTAYKGAVPLGVFRTWRFPSKQQIAAGARWTACVAILAPGPDKDTLKATVGSLSGALAGVTNPLPRLGRCAPTHTNAVFTPVTCEPGSTQWVWLGEHRKPSGAYPGKAKAQKTADDACRSLVSRHGGGGAWVYYPTSAASWATTRADWSCWMPLAKVKGK